MANETGPYEGGSGAGGKIRRQPAPASASARKGATPYDRPLSGRHAPAALRKASWFAKIVDPASRIIANSAVRFFSSVFKKRLPAPSSSEDDNREVQEDSIQEVPEEAVDNAMVTEPIGQDRDSTHGNRQKSEPELTELEQLLKNKTFSREEFNHLTELLQSRIVDSPSGLKEYEEKRRGELHGGVEPNNVANAEAQRWREERKKAREEKENTVWDNSLLGNTASPAVPPNPIHDDVGSSPADIAKAYMGVRPFRAASSALAMQGKIFRDESAPNRLNGQPLVPRTTEGWLVGNGQLEDRFKTPQMPRARSRIQSITRTPYARNVQRQASVERIDDGFPSNTPSTRWTPIQSPVTGGRQVLKRRSSVLDDGFASVGPMRRIRQKSAYTSLKKSDLSGSSSGQLIPLLSPGYDAGQNALSVTKRNTEREKYNDICSAYQVRNDATKNVSAGFAFVPPQSSETARKILEHLDRMVPSPKEKSAEAQLAIARDKSPSQLTVGMLNAHARRSTENIGASPLFDIHGSSSPVQTHNQSLGLGVSAADQKYTAKGKAPLFNSGAMPVEVPVPSGVGDATLQSSDSVSVRVDASSAVLDIPSIAPEKSKGFRMSALEESDEEGHGGKRAPVLGNGETGKFKSIQSDGNDGEMNSLKADKPMQTLFGGKASASTVLTTRTEANTVIPATSVAVSNFGGSANNISGFTFPVTPDSNSLLEPPPTPTPMPSPSNTGSTQLKMGNPTPTYNFGTSTASKGPVFSFTTNGPTDVDTSKPKFDFKFESKPETSFSSNAVAAAAAAAATTSASNPQGILGSESSASIFKGATSLSNSASIFSTPTAVTAPGSGIPSFGGSVCKADGMNSTPFSSPATTTTNNSNLAVPSSIAQGVASAAATTDHLFKSFSSADQNTSKSGNEITSNGLSPSPSLFGIANGTSTTPSNTALASNSASSLFSNSSGSAMGHALSSVPASSSVPFAFGSSASVSSLSSSSSATSLFSSGLSVTVGSTGSSLFGSGSAPSFGGSSASFGSGISPSFGGSSTSFSSGSTPSFGGSSGSFGSGSTPSFGGSSGSLSSGSTPSFGGSSGSFGSGNTPSFGGSSASFSSGSAPSFGGSSASFGSGSIPSFGGSSASFGSGSAQSFGGSSASFGSGSAPLFGGSSASFGSGSTPSFGGSSASFGSGSTPSFGGSSALFGSGSTPLFGGSSASVGSGSTPSFGGSSSSLGSGSAPSFGGSSSSFGSGSAPLFGGSSASFVSGSTPSFGGSTASFGSGSTPSFGGSSTSFGSGSSPSLGGSSASFGSGSSPSFGGSSASFGLGSSPSFGASSAAFGSASTQSFGLAQSFGASSATSSQTTTPSFGSGFGGTPSLPSAGFSFGGSVAANSPSFQFGASGSTSSASTFSFTASTGASPSTFTFGFKESPPVSQQSMFGLTSSTPFGVPTSPAANDQMNMEDSMAEDPAQVSNPAPSVFGQSASPASPFLFGSQSSAASTGQPVFQFGAQPGVANPNPFAAGAQSTFTPTSSTLEFPGGGFSLGAGGEKSGRKFIKAKRDKSRRK